MYFCIDRQKKIPQGKCVFIKLGKELQPRERKLEKHDKLREEHVQRNRRKNDQDVFAQRPAEQ